MKRVLLAAALSLALTGCSDDGQGDPDGATDIASGPLSGKVAGMSWTLANAQTDAFLSNDASFWVDLYGATVASCGAFGTGNSLIATIPKQLGTHPLSFSLNATFVVESSSQTENYIATQGAIRVDEITSTTVRGGLTMIYDQSNSVSGQFEATICP